MPSEPHPLKKGWIPVEKNPSFKKPSIAKRVAIYLGIFVVLLVTLYVLNQAADKASGDNPYGLPQSQLGQPTVALLNDPNYQQIITPKKLEERLEKKESLFVYFFAPDCNFCLATTPRLMPLAKEIGADIRQFNVKVFPNDYAKYGLEGWPTLIFFENGVEVDRTGNELSDSTESVYRDFLQKYTPKQTKS